MRSVGASASEMLAAAAIGSACVARVQSRQLVSKQPRSVNEVTIAATAAAPPWQWISICSSAAGKRPLPRRDRLTSNGQTRSARKAARQRSAAGRVK